MNDIKNPCNKCESYEYCKWCEEYREYLNELAKQELENFILESEKE